LYVGTSVEKALVDVVEDVDVVRWPRGVVPRGRYVGTSVEKADVEVVEVVDDCVDPLGSVPVVSALRTSATMAARTRPGASMPVGSVSKHFR
jgi:hypothetical protein